MPQKSEKIAVKKQEIAFIPIEYIDRFPDHPFKVKDDEEMGWLIDSIRENGMQTPIVVRPKDGERYEVVSGHRRLFACKRLGLETIEAYVKNMTRDEAIIALVDSNIQREHILPSEKAYAYKMKMEAIRRMPGRKRNDDLSEKGAPVVHLSQNEKSRDIVAEEAGESREQVRRYIRLTELVPELLQMVDDERIAFRPAVEISYLSEEQQRDLVETIDTEEATPSLAQAIRMKKLSQEGKLDTDTIFDIMSEQKPNQAETVKFKTDELKAFFPERTAPNVMKQVIVRLLTAWQKSREQKKAAENVQGAKGDRKDKNRDDDAR